MCQVTLSTDMQAPVLMCSQGARLMVIETHGNVVKRWCFITAKGLMDIFAGKLSHVYIINMTEMAVNFPKYMIVVYAFSAPAYIIHVADDEMYMLKNEGLIPTQCNHGKLALRQISFCSKPQKQQDERVDRHNSIKQLDKISHTACRKELVTRNQYPPFWRQIYKNARTIRAHVGWSPQVS